MVYKNISVTWPSCCLSGPNNLGIRGPYISRAVGMGMTAGRAKSVKASTFRVTMHDASPRNPRCTSSRASAVSHIPESGRSLVGDPNVHAPN